MKRLFCFFLCFSFVFCLFGCSFDFQTAWEQSYSTAESNVASRVEEATSMLHLDLVKVADCPEGSYFMEPVTGVMYLWISGGYKGGLSVMYDASGFPLTYDRFIALYNDINTPGSQE